MATNVQPWLEYLFSVGVRGGLLLAAAALATLALRRRSASTRHLVWAAGLGALAAVTALAWILPAWRIDVLPARSLSLLFVEGAPGAVPVTPSALPAAPAVIAAVAQAPRGGMDWPMVMLIVWAVPCAALLLRLLLGLRGAARLVRASLPLPPSLQVVVADALGSSGRLVPVRLSPVVRSPVTAGIRRPSILLPLEAQSWSADLVRAVLAHELGHVRRRDCASQVLARVVTAVHWWNPLCWLAEARMMSERERACDDHVLASGARPSSYARHLLELGRLLQGQPAVRRIEGAAILGCSQLTTRVETLLDAGRSHHLPGRRTALSALAAALLLAVPAACLTGDRDGEALLVYEVAPEHLETTAAVLTRRLDALGLAKAKISRETNGSAQRLQVQLPAQARIDVANVRAVLERRAVLAMTVVNDDVAYLGRLAAYVPAHPELSKLAGGKLEVVPEHLRYESTQLIKVLPYVRGPKAAMQWFVAHLPPELQPPEGHALVIDPMEIDQARVLLVDRRQGVTVTQVADAQVADTTPRSTERYEVLIQFVPQDASRLKALTAANLGQKMAIELGDGEVWGAPIIQSAFSDHVRVTAMGPRAEAERLAAAFRAGALPAPIKLVFTSAGSVAVGVGGGGEPR